MKCHNFDTRLPAIVQNGAEEIVRMSDRLILTEFAYGQDEALAPTLLASGWIAREVGIRGGAESAASAPARLRSGLFFVCTTRSCEQGRAACFRKENNVTIS